MYTEVNLIKQIYLKPGINLNEIRLNLGLGMPSVVYAKSKVKDLIIEVKNRNQVNHYLDFQNLKLISYLQQIELERFKLLPLNLQVAINDLLKSLDNKPVLSLIYGSYVRGNFSEKSDVDILLVFSSADVFKIEDFVRKISFRYSVNLQVVSLDFCDFRKSFQNMTNEFIKNIRFNKLILTGVRWWLELEQDDTYLERVDR